MHKILVYSFWYCINLFSKETSLSYVFLNVYGPYLHKVTISENIFASNFIQADRLNFSLGEGEFWGQRDQVDQLTDYFIQRLGDVGLDDIIRYSIRPTW